MANVFLDFLGDLEGIPITIGRARMQRLAKHWHYVLRSRRRWIDDDYLRETIEKRAASHLMAIGVGKERLETVAAAGVVQVSISLTSNTPGGDAGWEGRLMPWEYLLTAATAKYRNDPLIVVRHLKTERKSEARRHEDLGAAFVESVPGRLRGSYNFDIERKVLQAHLADSAKWDELRNPTLAMIKDFVGSRSPRLIHVSGIDSFLGTRLLAETGPGEIELREIRDGMFLRIYDCDETRVAAQAVSS